MPVDPHPYSCWLVDHVRKHAMSVSVNSSAPEPMDEDPGDALSDLEDGDDDALELEL